MSGIVRKLWTNVILEHTEKDSHGAVRKRLHRVVPRQGSVVSRLRNTGRRSRRVELASKPLVHVSSVRLAGNVQYLNSEERIGKGL